MKIEIVPSVYKLWSFQASILLTVLVAMKEVAPEFIGIVSEETYAICVSLLTIAIPVLRMIIQPTPKQDTK